jgi:hypothetical protein
MTNIVGRVKEIQSKSYVKSAGEGWQIGGAAFSNPAGTLNLLTSPTFDYEVTSPTPGTRNAIRMLPEGYFLLDTSIALNSLVVGTTGLFLVPAGLNLEVKSVLVECVISTAVTVEASASVGLVSETEGVYASQILSGLLAVGDVYRFPSGGRHSIIPGGQVLTFFTTVAATGTTQNIQARVFGRLFV